MKQNAFTLIELLVVIAIIAILAAILFPVFAQAKLAAKKVVGLSNMKQIALAEQLYQGDYDDHLVKSQIGAPTAWSSAPALLRTWRHTMQPYMKNTQLLADSTNQFSSVSDNCDPDIVINGAFDSDTTDLSSNFAANDAIIGFGNYQTYGDPYDNPGGLDDSSAIQYPANTIEFFPNNTVFQDGHWYWGSNDTDGNLFTNGSVAQSNGSQLMSVGLCIVPGGEYSGNSTHVCPGLGAGPLNNVGKVVNFAWADGHAKAEAYTASLRTSDPTNDDWGATLYAIDTQNTPISLAERQWAATHLFTQYQ